MVTDQAVGPIDRANDAGHRVGKRYRTGIGRARQRVAPVRRLDGDPATYILVASFANPVAQDGAAWSRADQAVAGIHHSNGARVVVEPGNRTPVAIPVRAAYQRPAVALVVDTEVADVVAGRSHQAIARTDNAGERQRRVRVDEGDGARAAVPSAGAQVIHAAAQRHEITVAHPVVVVVPHQAVGCVHDTRHTDEPIGNGHRTGVGSAGQGVVPICTPDRDLVVADVLEVAKATNLVACA